MNKRQKIVQEQFLNNEDEVIRRLKDVYGDSLKDIEEKTQALQDEINRLGTLADLAADDEEKAKLLSMQQSKIYQKQYQDAMKKQIGSILDNMQVEEFKAVSEYLQKCYEDGFIGTMYDLQGQGIPLCFPMDQEAVVRAVQLDSKIKGSLYEHFGEDVKQLKKHITSEVSRGIATGMSFDQIARQISGKMVGTYNTPGGSLARAMTIARTEGHRVQVQGTMDACHKAKDKGADVVKQWDSTLDSNTRPSHQRVDGEIRELDEPFSNGLMFPGDPAGGAAEVVNCRCALLQRARWALDDNELETLKKRAEYFGLDKTRSFEDFKKKYRKTGKSSGKVGDTDGYTIIDEVVPFDFSDKKKIVKEINDFLNTYADSEIEHSVVISPNGKLYRLTGTQGVVNPEIIGADALIGSIGAHNHPVWNGFDRGDSFSLEDVTFAVEHKTGVEYLTTGNKVYSFKYSGSLSLEKIAEEYENAEKEALSIAFEKGYVLEFRQEAIMRILAERLDGFEFYENL